jgi:stearoyl-CoA desaturase (delta-9 desaturase)
MKLKSFKIPHLGENVKKVYIPAHIIVILGIIFFIASESSKLWLLLIYPSWFLFGHIGFGIFMHKYYCHKSFETYPWLARTGAYLGMLAGTGSPVMLKALHIGQHHPNSDSEADPHTPKKGFWWSYFLWLNHKWDFKKLWIVRDIMKDPFIKFYHNHYYKIYWGTWAILFIINWKLAIFTISTATVIEFHLSGIVNSFGHLEHKGSYQNYPNCGDNSQNITWLNWLTLGLGLHNNHHGEPWNYNYARKPGEFDFSAWFIPLISIDKKAKG